MNQSSVLPLRALRESVGVEYDYDYDYDYEHDYDYDYDYEHEHEVRGGGNRGWGPDVLPCGGSRTDRESA